VSASARETAVGLSGAFSISDDIYTMLNPNQIFECTKVVLHKKMKGIADGAFKPLCVNDELYR